MNDNIKIYKCLEIIKDKKRAYPGNVLQLSIPVDRCENEPYVLNSAFLRVFSHKKCFTWYHSRSLFTTSFIELHIFIHIFSLYLPAKSQ